MEYKYITEDNLEQKQTYMYSEFGGTEFLQAYKKSRDDAILFCDEERIGMVHCTRDDLNEIKDSLKTGNYLEKRELLDLYVKRFEVSKRLYNEYNEKWRKTENASFIELDLYLLLAECCELIYEHDRCTKYLSCLLKIDDTLISTKDG